MVREGGAVSYERGIRAGFGTAIINPGRKCLEQTFGQSRIEIREGRALGGLKFLMSEVPLYLARKVDIRLPGKGNSNSHGARPVD